MRSPQRVAVNWDKAQQASVVGIEALGGIKTLIYLIHSFFFSIMQKSKHVGKQKTI